MDQDRHVERAVPRARQQVAIAIALVAACGGTTHEASPPPGAPSGIPCDVDAVLAANCRGCHSSPPQHGAPMPLTRHARVRAVASKIAARIADDADPMPPAPNARLSDDERATLTRWIEAGAPETTERCAPAPATQPVPALDCTPDVSLRPASKWTMPKDAVDQYVCYGFDIARPTPTHVTGFAPRIDNTKIVHHVVLYESPEPVSATPTACDAFGSIRWRMVAGWAPGGTGFAMPEGVGFPLATDRPTHYVLVIHYGNPLGLEGETDETGYDLCTEAPRAEEAEVIAFGTQSFTIPATGQPFTRDCTVGVPAALAGRRFFSAMPHMHGLGTSMSTTLERDGAAVADLGTIDRFAFDTQPWLAIDAAASETRTGDVIRTRCTWTNDTGKPVGFGTGTAEEMCYSFTVVYPRVTLPGWSWAAPAVASNCK